MNDLFLSQNQFLSQKDICKKLSISERTFYYIIKNKTFNAYKHKNTKYYLFNDILRLKQEHDNIILNKKKQKQEATIKNIKQRYNKNNISATFGQLLQTKTDEELYSLGIQLIKQAVQRHSKKTIQEQKEIIENQTKLIKNQELTIQNQSVLINKLREYSIRIEKQQIEQQKLEAKKYQNQKLRNNISHLIRQKAQDMNIPYNILWGKYYTLYINSHCFSKPETFTKYIDKIEERGHLEEFYYLVQNN